MNYTKREIAKIIQKYVDYYLYEADVGEDLDKRDYEVSYEKINNLGFVSKVDIYQGVQELVKVLKHIVIKNDWRNA